MLSPVEIGASRSIGFGHTLRQFARYTRICTQKTTCTMLPLMRPPLRAAETQRKIPDERTSPCTNWSHPFDGELFSAERRCTRLGTFSSIGVVVKEAAVADDVFSGSAVAAHRALLFVKLPFSNILSLRQQLWRYSSTYHVIG